MKPGKIFPSVVLLFAVSLGSPCTTAGQIPTGPQAAAACAYSIAPSTASALSGVGTGTVTVTTASDCSWTASSNAAWITLTSGASGAGSAPVTYSVPANTGASARAGTLTIAGQTFTLTQAGSPGGPGPNLLVNGSFEQPAGGERRGLRMNSTYIPGWVVTRDTIDYFGGLYTCSDGSYCMDLDGDPGYGSIAQTFATTPGVTYTVTFDLAGNPDGPPLTKRLRVLAAGQQAEFSFTMSGTTQANPGWIPLTWSFTASAATTTLEFQSLDTTGSYYGPLLDNVRVLGGAGGLACTYTITPTTQSVSADGGNLTINVAAATGCAWTATAGVPWINITSGASGSGQGTVNASVAANLSSPQRTGNLTIAGQTVVVMQAGTPGACIYSFDPPAVSVPPAGTASGLLSVFTASNCGWSSSASVAWIAIISGASTGSGTVTYTVAPNTGPARSGAITIVGQTVTVSQAGTGGACSYEISPVSTSLPAEGTASGSLSVTAPANCAWTASASPGWISITSGASGPGNGTVRYTVAVNTGDSRTGTITLTGQTGAVGVITGTLTITQAASGCTYNIAPASASVPAAGTTSGSIAVAATSGCAWTATSAVPWIAITSGASGTGSGTVSYTVAANTGPARTATITIAGQTHAVNQAAGAGPQPAINAGGVVSAADYSANLAPGGIFSVLGSNLASATRGAASIPLPTSLEGVSVEVVDGARVLTAPLFFVSAGQINAQMPFDITSSSVQVRVRAAAGQSSPQVVNILPRAPRLFTKTLDGKGEAILVHANYTVDSAAAPASPAEIVILYLTGLGGVSPSIAAGQAGGDGGAGGPLNNVNEDVTVTVDGRPATVYFAGLAPYFVGLYQVNFQVPEATAAGMPAIKVRAAQQESQAGVTFACGAK